MFHKLSQYQDPVNFHLLPNFANLVVILWQCSISQFYLQCLVSHKIYSASTQSSEHEKYDEGGKGERLRLDRGCVKPTKIFPKFILTLLSEIFVKLQHIKYTSTFFYSRSREITLIVGFDKFESFSFFLFSLFSVKNLVKLQHIKFTSTFLYSRFREITVIVGLYNFEIFSFFLPSIFSVKNLVKMQHMYQIYFDIFQF